jgi:hypothetical protein
MKKENSDKNQSSFQDCSIVACGTMRPELNHLKETGFLDAQRILYTKPGRHENPRELENQLIKQLVNARKYSDNVIVVYGGKFCYMNAAQPARTIDDIIREQGPAICRTNATHCVDMLTSSDERTKISKGEKVLWFTPGWVLYRNYVFEDWDKGKANEHFPQHRGGVILLDGVNFWNSYSEKHPKEILDFCDWMGIPIASHEISLNRFKTLLLDTVQSKNKNEEVNDA